MQVSDKLTALHAAAINGNIKGIELLGNASADFSAKDFFGETPLFSAIKWCVDKYIVDTVKTLLEFDTKVKAIDIENRDGIQPVMLAFKKKQPKVLELLLENGASISEQLAKVAIQILKNNQPQSIQMYKQDTDHFKCARLISEFYIRNKSPFLKIGSMRV